MTMGETAAAQDVLADLGELTNDHYEDIDDVVAYCRALRDGHTDEEARQIANDEEGTGPVSAAVESYPALQWREGPPTEPGLYWIDDPRYDDPRVAKVYEEKRELKAKGVGGGVFTVDDEITFSPDRWAGPIPEPVDEAESAG